MLKQKDIPWIELLKNYFKYRSTKQWFSIVIIAAFTALIVPREWIHDCSHNKSISCQETHFQDGNCYVCDFQLAAFKAPEFILFSFQAHSNTCCIWSVCEKESTERVQNTELRGPPVLI